MYSCEPTSSVWVCCTTSSSSQPVRQRAGGGGGGTECTDNTRVYTQYHTVHHENYLFFVKICQTICHQVRIRSPLIRIFLNAATIFMDMLQLVYKVIYISFKYYNYRTCPSSFTKSWVHYLNG